MKAIENARTTTPAKFLYSLGIAGIGLSNAKLILKRYHNDFSLVMSATRDELVDIDGIGEVLADSIADYFDQEVNKLRMQDLLQELKWSDEGETQLEQVLEGKTFVITGSLKHFGNREELKTRIEQIGGKVTGTVTNKTSYLINNDNTSQSSKNKKAKALGIDILTEEDLFHQYPSLRPQQYPFEPF